MKRPNMRHEAFIRYYTGHPTMRFNATKCYQQIYVGANYKTAQSNGCKLVRKLRTRIDEAIERSFR